MMKEKIKAIDNFIIELENTHPDLYRYYNKELFYNDMQMLKQKDLSLNNFKVELAKILAKFKDSHTWLSFDKKTIVQLRKLGDDIYIIDDYKNKNSNYKYKKIVDINGFEINDVISKVIECIPHETYNFNNYLLEENLLSEELLKGLNIVSDNIIITLEDGTIIDYNEELKKEYIKDIVYFENKKINNDTYYIKYGICDNIGNINLEEWFDLIVDKLSSLQYNNVIVDLRGNTGGNSKYFYEFCSKLKKYSNDLSFITLVDRGVFSSGIFALTDMIELNSYIIGEKVGATQNHFGYITMLKLLDFNISCSNSEWLLKNNDYIRYQKGDEVPLEIKERNDFEIDEEIEENIEYYINDVDPYIDRALEYINYKIK